MARGAGGVQLNRVQGVMGMEMENGLGLAKPRTPQSTEHPNEPPQLGGHPEMGLPPGRGRDTPGHPLLMSICLRVQAGLI